MNIIENSKMKYGHFSKYIIKKNKEGQSVIIPSKDAEYIEYDPTEIAEEILIDLLNTMQKCEGAEIETAEELILAFVNKYGLLGSITEIPLNKDFYKMELTFVDTNQFSGAGVIATDEFESKFFLDELPNLPNDFQLTDYLSMKNYCEPIYFISSYMSDLYNTLILADKMKNEPEAVSFLLNNKLKTNIRYSLTVTDKIQMHYEFNSLMAVLNFTMARLLSAEGSPLKICKHCGKAFISENKRAEFCSERCRNQFNVYKSRAKAKQKK